MNCRDCKCDLPRILNEKYRGYFIYVDDRGERWYGKRCPDCYKQYKLKYDMRRRLAAGHVPLGTPVACRNCGAETKLQNGCGRKCEGCK